jgi:hypothetical protein
MTRWRSSSIINATARLLFLASQSEDLFALALFQKVMINLNPMAVGVNFQRGLFALAGLSWDSTINPYHYGENFPILFFSFQKVHIYSNACSCNHIACSIFAIALGAFAAPLLHLPSSAPSATRHNSCDSLPKPGNPVRNISSSVFLRFGSNTLRISI